MIRSSCVLLFLCCMGHPPSAEFRGRIDLFGGAYRSQDLEEGRVRVFTRYDHLLGDRWYVRAGAYVDAVTRSGSGEETIARLHEIYFERRGDRVEFRVGYSQLVWGVLDEIQPTDVVNSLDLARFFLEGRSEGRLPAPMILSRFSLPARLTLEAVWVPSPRDGTFDQLDEDTSPFSPIPLTTDQRRALPGADLPNTLENSEYGVRLRDTGRRVEWGASLYHDVTDFDLFESGPAPLARAVRPSRWMLGGEMETVAGAWTVRAEVALFRDDPLQSFAPIEVVESDTAHGGIGVNRRLGETSIFVHGLYREIAEHPGLTEDDELSLTGGVVHRFGRGTRDVRLFWVWNKISETGFARAVFIAELRNNLKAELSGGLFLGESGHLLAALEDADFVGLRLRFYF